MAIVVGHPASGGIAPADRFRNSYFATSVLLQLAGDLTYFFYENCLLVQAPSPCSNPLGFVYASLS